ncbi:MAG: YgjP-like metallopeptidase domain-containing protein [Nitrososphaerales archaeon]
MTHLDLGTRRIEYSVVRGASKRYTYFRFRPDMTLEVSVPRGRKVDVEAMIKERLSWIDHEYARAANAMRILGSDRVMFGGQYLRIAYIEDARDELVPSLTSGEVAIRTSDRRRVRELVRRWFLKETSTYVVRKVRESSPLLGVKPSRVDVREISKWGYCTRGGRLSFSWQLIALPERLREYVVLHELTHLVEFNHSPAFKKRLASVCPDFRRRERELAQIVPYDRMVLE